VDGLISFLRSHPSARRSLSVLSALLLVGAAAFLGYPVYTNFQHDRLQGNLDTELASPRLQQAYKDREIGVGDALTRIKIPALGVDTGVVEGTTETALRAGAGHYPMTSMPCDNCNMAIAGHRTTYGKPFANIDQLRPGDTINLQTPVGSCDYEVEKAPPPFRSPASMAAAWVVAPNDLRVIDQDPAKAELTLTTCHPRGSAKERLIIRARKVSGKAGSG
jgi:sortase A